MMREVVDEGTGKRAAIPGVSVAGKTGTAQKAFRGKYGGERTASFVGLVPAEKPQYLVVIFIDEPSKVKYGGVIAAPVFKSVTSRVMAYHGSLPDPGALTPAQIKAQEKAEARARARAVRRGARKRPCLASTAASWRRRRRRCRFGIRERSRTWWGSPCGGLWKCLPGRGLSLSSRAMVQEWYDKRRNRACVGRGRIRPPRHAFFGFRSRNNGNVSAFVTGIPRGRAGDGVVHRLPQGDPRLCFVALPGSSADGSQFIADAVARGAGYVVCRPESAGNCGEAEVVDCADPRQALGLLARARYGTASLPFPVVGVTGTNGKTTTTYLLDHLFASAGKKTGVLGTVSYRWPGHHEDAPMTTPDCLDVHTMLADMRAAGVDMAFMEVSSHALDQNRVAGVGFGGAVFSNLTQDHLDYHHDMETYFKAKAKLFLDGDGKPFADRVMAIGTDNPWGARLAGMAPEAIGFGLTASGASGRYLEGKVLSSTTAGLRLHARFEGREWKFTSPLVGNYNAENLLAVQAVALGFGLDPEAFRCFETFCGVPGRLERILNPQNLDVFVDYAHTPDALINVLNALRGAGFKRIVTVFGCGGNRDRAKRPLMGEAVARLSDVAVLTSDNPRHEEPEAIMADVMPGLSGAAEVFADPDRRRAIEKGLELLHPGDALLIAGKGHESTQQIGDVKHPFSDQQTVQEILGCA